MNAAVKELNNNTTSDDSRLLLTRDQMGWDTLRAVKTGRVFVVDGDGMFHRPTGRLLDALEWLESVIREKEQEEGDDEIRIKNNNSNDSNSDSIIPYVKWSTSQSSSSSKSSASSSTQDITQIEELHTQACLACKSTYKDPSTGYSVMTEHALLKRGECCGNACRHCPYGHIGVKEVGRRRNRAQRPVILAGNKKKNKKRSRLFSRLMEPLFHQQQQQQQQDGSDTTAKITIVFWSGGKDSLLALVHVLENRNEMNDVSPLFLLTTFDPETRMVPIQNIPIEE